MQLTALSFENYRVFPGKETLELRPLTVLIGRNSSGKSVITRLPLLLAQALSDRAESPLGLRFQEFDFGESFVDLIHNRVPHGAVSVGASFREDTGETAEFRVKIQHFDEYKLQHITHFEALKNNDPIVTLNWVGHDPLVDTHKYYCEAISGDCEASFHGLFPHTIQASRDYRESVSGQITTLNDLFRFGEFEFGASQLRNRLATTMGEMTYLGPFRRAPDRSYRFPGSSVRSVGFSGNRAPELLGDDFLRRGRDVFGAASYWIAEYLGGWSLDLVQHGDRFSLVLRHPDNPSVEVNIVDVGTGIAQVLPLVVQRQFDSVHSTSGRIEIVEQPELHLHPGAHGDLADLYVNAVKDHRGQFIIETHSENFLLRIRRRIAERRLGPDAVIIYWIDDETEAGRRILPIHIHSDGEVDMWPKGIFSEDFDEVHAIRLAQKEGRQ